MSKKELYEALMQKNRAAVWRICCSWMKYDQDREDLFQEIQIQIWLSMDRFREDSSWNTFIYRIAMNTAIKHNLKLKKAQFELENQLDSIPIEENVEGDSTQDELEKLRTAVNKLSESDRVLITLVLEDLSYQEISEILESTVNTIGVRINRAKKRLLNLMNTSL